MSFINDDYDYIWIKCKVWNDEVSYKERMISKWLFSLSDSEVLKKHKCFNVLNHYYLLKQLEIMSFIMH